MLHNFLRKYYFLPNTAIYKSIEYLTSYRNVIFIFIAIIVLLYPISQIINYQITRNKIDENLLSLNQEIEQQNKLYQVLLKKQKETNEKDRKLTKINQDLEQLFTNYNAEIENLQWQFDSGKTISIAINQQESSLFNIINEIAALPMLRFREIVLIKLEKKRLIQLNATLQLIE